MYRNAKLRVSVGCLFMLLSAACSHEGSKSSPPSETTSVSSTDSSNACLEKVMCDIEADNLRPTDESDPSFAKKNRDYIWKKNECARIKCRDLEFNGVGG